MSGQEFPASVERFVGTLNHLLESSVSTTARFDARLSSDGAEAVVQVRDGPDARSAGVALVRSHDDPDGPALFLRARYIVEVDARRDDLRVSSSTVGLWADVTGGRKRPRPLVRVEYDRRQSARGRAAAHVHLHANSPELAWMYGSAGRPAPDLHALHFPVGGRRFRPTLEEFLLFLDRESLFNDWKEGWKPRLTQSLEAWERRQARATARQFPEEAVGALETLGYSVTAPRV
ncbi:MAG: hypothetical protein OXI26_02045 [bacterium]|nr:hypothetical protein [bacterium]